MIDSISSSSKAHRGRRAVIQFLKTEGPMTAQAISEQLGVTAMAVRQHLYELAEKGMVDFDERRQGAGRPSKHWKLTSAADSFFPDGHADLAVGLIHTVRATFGEEGIQQLIAVRTKTQHTAYSRALEKCETIKDRLDALARIRTDEGYMAEVTCDAQGDFVFQERHCPVCAAAQACTGLCASELDVFQRVLGPDVSVERTDHILAGAQRCAYRVRSIQD
ncbi:MAG: transcriptional regulator [Alphaproteobacteria bacterium]|nr:transcriptional regulator [Alphaproteobacteria bacterium]